MIGKRLKIARSAAGLSQRGLADKMGGIVTHAAITKYENDLDMPSSRVLIALSRALNTRVDALLSEAPIEIASVDFRKAASTKKREIAQLEAALCDYAERYLFIEECLALPSSAWHRPNGDVPNVLDVADAEAAAEWLRKSWRLGTDPIPNLVELLEDRGAKVLFHPFEKIHGVLASVEHNGAVSPFIVVNSNDSGERQRFTLAHELGHLILEGQQREGLDGEKVAHRFAGAFLLPAETVRTALGERRSSISFGELFALKELFSVSVQVIAHRAMALGIISQDAYTNLFRQFSKSGWRGRVPEPVPVPRERPKRFERLVTRALSEDAISPAKAAELLRLPVRALDQLLDAPPDPQAPSSALALV